MQHQRQRAKHRRVDGAGDAGAVQRMLPRQFAAAQPQHEHCRELHSGDDNFLSGFDHFRTGYPFLHPGEYLIVAALNAEINQLKSGLLQQLQVRRSFPQDIERTAVTGDAGKLGEMGFQQLDDRQKPVGGQDQRIAVGEEYPAQIGVMPRGLLDDRLDFRQRPGPEIHAPIHGTERATIMGATDRNT